MIVKLTIKNYILIEKLSIDFEKGFSVLTGETGAGKSIILGALNLISGSRIDHKIVSPSHEKCIVEGEFRISKNLFLEFFKLHDIDFDELTIIRREILKNGKSRAFINDSPVKLELLKVLSERLINIHNQNHNHILSNDDLFYNLLDTYANQLNELKQYRVLFNEFNKKKSELDFLKNKKINFLKTFEYNKFIFDQIDKMNLQEGEKLKLEESFKSLKNFDKMTSLFEEFKSLSLIGDEYIQQRILKLSANIKKLSNYSIDFEHFYKRIERVNIELEDLFSSINNFLNNLSFDQDNFEKIQNRLYKINELERKHNLKSVRELIKKKNELKNRLNESVKYDDKIKTLKNNLEDLEKELLIISKNISSKRLSNKEKIQSNMEDVFRNLSLKNSKIEFSLSESNNLNKNGINNIDVLYYPNSKLKPNILSKIASGGEKSRILFAIKSVLSKKIKLPTLVFDEIDSGTSGEVANTIGKMMKNMGLKIQIISITHLPQVASRADHHFKVFKTNFENKIVTNIKKLDNSKRANEIAAMISGENITNSAIDQAYELLK